MDDTSRVNDTERASAAPQGQPPAQPLTPEPELITAAPAGAPVPRRRSWVKQLLLWAVLLLIVGNGVLFWLQRDRVLDWVHSRGYEAPTSIQTLANNTSMTPYAKRLFYVNYPAIEDKNDFNRNCPDASHEVAVLGCYRGNRNGIHLYRVTDVRLAGITEVTAAHEMLHQAFDRLDAAEQKRVGSLLDDYYKSHLTDQNVKDKIASYKKLEPGDLVNEMHSIFGTEVSDLPPALETYYKQYFTNRRAVLDYRNKYVSAFSARQNQIDAYDAQRDDLKKQIDQAQSDLDLWVKNLNVQRDRMNAWLAANDVDRYNAAVPAFNAEVARYKVKVADTNKLINDYNDITDKRNALTAQEQELLQAQDNHASSANAE